MPSEFLIHVELPQITGNVIMEWERRWALVYRGQNSSQTWTLGRLGFWEWDTSRDYCLLYDDRAGAPHSNTGSLPTARDEFIVLGLKGFNPHAATFGFQDVAAWGRDRAFNPAPRGTWEIIATPEQLNEVRDELVKLQKEINDAYTQIALDVVGCVDPTPISDLLGAAMCIRQREFVGAALSLVSVFPYIGDLVGKSAKFARVAARVRSLYERLKRVMHTLQILEQKAARAKAAAREALERARVLREKAVREAAEAEMRVRRAFRTGIQRKFKDAARRAGWHPEDLARACEWCKFSEPPKFVIARKRSGNFAKFEGKPGFRPKPMDVKLKTAKSGPRAGLVVKPTEAELADIVRREGQKSADAMRKNIAELEAKGWKFDQGGCLMDPQGNRIYSDIDFMGIYNIPKGRGATAWGGRLIENDDPIFVDWINNTFFKGKKLKQHGNQDRFTKDLESAAQDFGHKPGRGPDADEMVEADAFLVIGPDGIPVNCTWQELKTLYAKYGVPNPYD